MMTPVVHTRPPGQRIQHRCGRFLAELNEGMLHIVCVRCKALVALVLDRPSKELRIIQHE